MRAAGCDVLIHEVLRTNRGEAARLPGPCRAVPPTTSDLTELAKQAKPGLLILHHASLSLRPAGDSERSSPAASLNEVSKYSGRGVVGRDLDVYRAEKWRRGRDSNPRRDVMPSTDFESVPL
jgi:ribonuclease BN (tRNA processing enzyme)